MFTYKMVIQWGGFVLGSLLLAACTKPAAVAPQEAEQSSIFSLDQVEIVEGMLAFEDENTFWEAVSFLTEPDLDAYLAWAQGVHFTSLWHDYEKFSAYSAASYEKGYDQSIAALRVEYGQAVQLEDDGMFWLNCPLPGAARLLNQEGVVKVGDALYAFEADRMIIIEDGDKGKLQIARRLTESNESAGIQIEKVAPYRSNRQQCGSFFYRPTYNTHTIIFENEWCFRLPAANPPNNCNYKLRVKIKNTQRETLELLAIELRGYRRGAFGMWFAYNDRKTITGTTATLNGSHYQTGIFTKTNDFYGIGGNNNVLERKVFDSSFPNVNAYVYVPSPQALNPPANSGISGYGGYTSACVDFNIEFFHPHPGSPVFIEI